MMKKFLSLLAMMMVVSCAMAQASKQVTTPRTVYYVVVGSFTSLNEARTFNVNGVADTTFGNIYEVTVNGQTRYRVCVASHKFGCFAKKKAARKQQTLLKSLGVDTWIWANAGEAHCVEIGSCDNGDIPVPYTTRVQE